jgi:hypothetical protein
MKKIVVIGDIHGKSVWKEIVNKETDADTIIFIGDYLDSWDISPTMMAENFQEIVKFKEDSNKEIILLVGNHDLSYICSSCRCSGYNLELDSLVGNFITKLFNDKFIKTFHIEGNILFSHAGVTKSWLSNTVNYLNIESKNIFTQINIINSLVAETPSLLKYVAYDTSNRGFHIDQGPVWVRPPSLLENKLDTIEQVVGHTLFRNIHLQNNIHFIDVLDSKIQYLTIEFTDNELYHKYFIKEIDIIQEEITKLQQTKN